MLRISAAIALLLLLPASARAQAETSAAGDPVLEGAARAADAYWTRMGVRPVDTPALYTYDDPDPDINGRADLCVNRIGVTNRVRGLVRLPGLDASDRRMMLVIIGGTMVHERGHTLCLQHDSGWPVMSHSRKWQDAPREVWEWAATMAPDPAKVRTARLPRFGWSRP
jgi:hypothetical protein